MAELRCPMCSRANPEDLDECQFCGARLKPLVAGGQSEPREQVPDQSSSSDQPESQDQTPDWLARIRARASEEEDEDRPPRFREPGESDEEETGPGGSPGWLSRLREIEPEEVGPPSGEVPDWALEDLDGPEDDDQDDVQDDVEQESSGSGWLSRLRPQDDEGIKEQEPGVPQAGAGVDFELPEEGELATELPGWLDEISDEIPPESELGEWGGDQPEMDYPASGEPEGMFDARAGTGGPSGLDGEREQEETEFPSWADQEADQLSSELEQVEPQPGEPDLSGIRDEPTAFEVNETAYDLEPEESKRPYKEPGSEPFTEGFDELEAELPDWLDELDDEDGEFEQSAEELEQLEAAELPSWVDQARPPAEDDEEQATDLEFEWEEDDYPPPAPEEKEPDLPHVPAFDARGAPGEADPGSEMDLDAIELPDWLSDVSQDGEAPEPAPAGERASLAPASIPNWLEAMRPVETIQPVVDLEDEEEPSAESVESVGPLAGLRGVLMAEPVVAKPRTSTTVATGLEVTERQYAQADLLRRIVEDEQRELTGIAGRRRRWPLVRWILALVVILAVGLIPISGAIQFAIPTVISRDLGAVVEQVNAVPVDRPVLMVFDYEPGYSSEVQAVAGPLMEHLFRRDLNVVTVSTKPTGPPLALELVGRAAQDHGAEAGRDFLHLGYLSGGPSAVQLFSADPRFTVLDGFMIPTAFRDQALWEQPLLRDITRLSDFGMVVVIASGTDSARTWAEQAPPWLGDTPLLMVLSAGAEPLMRPYFEALNPTVNGILTGLPAGVYYEQLNGKPALAEQRWSAFGIGTFVIELAMLAGLGWGAFWWIMDFREKRAQR